MADHHVLAQLVSLAGLIAATAEYCEILRRREVRRLAQADRLAAAETGLYGLVRVIAADRDR
jgi:hypothetical protein